MPKFLCSYAYDQPYYTDFTVIANNKKAAEKIIKAALKAGKFETVTGDTDYSMQDERVFIQEELKPKAITYYPPLQELLHDAAEQ